MDLIVGAEEERRRAAARVQRSCLLTRTLQLGLALVTERQKQRFELTTKTATAMSVLLCILCLVLVTIFFCWGENLHVEAGSAVRKPDWLEVWLLTDESFHIVVPRVCTTKLGCFGSDIMLHVVSRCLLALFVGVLAALHVLLLRHARPGRVLQPVIKFDDQRLHSTSANWKALVLWFGLVVLVEKKLPVQMQIYDKMYIMGHLWFEAKWSSGRLVILSVWSGLVGSGLALVWSCSKTNQSLPVFLMYSRTSDTSSTEADWTLRREADLNLVPPFATSRQVRSLVGEELNVLLVVRIAAEHLLCKRPVDICLRSPAALRRGLICTRARAQDVPPE
jgi:hypothetical protein